MDDLAGLDWTSSSSATKTTNSSANAPSFAYPALQPTPPSLSGRSTPSLLSAQASGRQAAASPFSSLASKPATPANDSFSNLLAGNKSKQNAPVSMQERQRQLLEEKVKQEQARQKQFDSHFGANELGSFGGNAGSGKITPDPAPSRLASPPVAGLLGAGHPPRGSDSDLLAAFSADAPVDRTSHFPASVPRGSTPGTPAEMLNNGLANDLSQPSQPGVNQYEEQEDDDPFGLATMSRRAQAQPQPAAVAQANGLAADDDDGDNVLGLLGKPAVPRQDLAPARATRRPQSPDGDSPLPVSLDPRDKAVAELVDMGFPADKAADALAQTETGLNVQAAVGLLLNQAHEEAKQKSRGTHSDRRPSPHVRESHDERPSRGEQRDAAVPAWMRDERSQSAQRRTNNHTPSQDKDVTQYASDLGTSVWKSANSLWKSGQKKVQKAVADFNADAPADTSQPKWMRDAQAADRQPPIMRQAKPDVSMTDEAALLESGGGRPQKPIRQQQQLQQHRGTGFAVEERANTSRFNDLPERPVSRPRSPPRSRAPPAAAAVSSSRGFKFDDDAATSAYTSSARRRGATPKSSSPAPQQEDIFSPPKAVQPRPNGAASTPQAAARPGPSRPRPSTPPRPKAPPRQVPSVAPAALASSAQHRQAGSDSFKRGDYAAAHTSYSSALTALASPNHPIAIVILCNRATTNLKVGDPKAAVADADRALEVIGPGLGQGEMIATADAPGGGGEKSMTEFYGKALMRRAEALEHMEKWADAARAWRLAVEAGAGGAVSIQGRNRCEKVDGGGGAGTTNGTSAPAAAPPARKVVPSRPTVPVSRPPVSTAKSAEAVKKLRAQHAADSAAEDEKFALADSVDAKLVAWKGSKADNLRALLGSLDTVLWAGAGWTKVGMADLVMPGRVKIVYMKAIGKVHPDKTIGLMGYLQIPQDATTEQRMISAAVFSTLNEAWDKFKQENGL